MYFLPCVAHEASKSATEKGCQAPFIQIRNTERRFLENTCRKGKGCLTPFPQVFATAPGGNDVEIFFKDERKIQEMSFHKSGLLLFNLRETTRWFFQFLFSKVWMEKIRVHDELFQNLNSSVIFLPGDLARF